MRLKRHFGSILTSCLMAVLIFGLGGCSKEESPKSSTAKTVMVNQYVTQPILDAVLAGMQERLSQEFQRRCHDLPPDQ